jgi:hypothetical protein
VTVLNRRLKLLLKVLLALFVLLVAFLCFERIRGQFSLAGYKRELLAQGEKLSPQDFRSPVAEADNGARTAIAAIEQFQRGTVLPHCYPPRMKMGPSGRAVVCFRESEWVETGTYRNGEWVNEKVTNRWDQVAADLNSNATVLTEIRTALAKPVLNNRLDLAEGNKMKFLHLAPAKSLTHWQGAEIQLALHEGRTHDALEPLLAQIQLPRLLAEDPIVISELVRIAIAAIARVDTWEALQADGWSDKDLAAMQNAWENQEFVTNLARTLEGERVFCDVSFDSIRGSNQDAYDLLFGWQEMLAGGFDTDTGEWNSPELPFNERMARFLKKQIYCRIWRLAWSYQNERHDLATMQELIDIARLAARNKSYGPVEEATSRLLHSSVGKDYYDRLRYPYSALDSISKTPLKALRAETERSLVISAIALKRYSLRHGNLPETLATLVPEFLSAVPTDYMDGEPVKYRRNGDGSFTLYSVGEDGQDDGGDTSLPADKLNTRQPWLRKDFVWPAPATPEEVGEYRREAAKD